MGNGRDVFFLSFQQLSRSYEDVFGFLMLFCLGILVWAGQGFGAKGNVLVWLLPRWKLEHSFACSRGKLMVQRILLYFSFLYLIFSLRFYYICSKRRVLTPLFYLFSKLRVLVQCLFKKRSCLPPTLWTVKCEVWLRSKYMHLFVTLVTSTTSVPM